MLGSAASGVANDAKRTSNHTSSKVSGAGGGNPLELAKRLVRAVARAFYADDTVVVLDALLRDRHVKDTDIDTRLGVGAKQARRLLTELLEERLIKTEDIVDELTGKRELFYYIDFSHFTNVVRYRIHLMHRELERMEREANDNQTYECPVCGRALPLLEVQPLRNKRYGFCCPTCCSSELHATCEGSQWQLRPKTGVTGFEEVQALKEKMRAQMYGAASETSAALHDGIYNLLSALEHKPLPSNLPSELIAVGVGGLPAGGTELQRRRREGAGGGTGGHAGGSSIGIFEDLAASTRDGGIQADEETGETTPSLVRPARAQPSFLQGSRVIKEVADPLQHETRKPQATGNEVADGLFMHKVEEEAKHVDVYRQAYAEAFKRGVGVETIEKSIKVERDDGGLDGSEGIEAVEEEDVDWEEGE